ncbi:lron-3 [Pristionchus pacificus]|nr:lron-3 [Pristionchus pacificus]
MAILFSRGIRPTEGPTAHGRPEYIRLRMLGSLLIFSSLFVLSHGRERNSGRQQFASEDPNSRFICEGQLAEYAACQCNEAEGDVSCINAQFVDTNIFASLGSYYKGLNRITFHGNNFQDLPTGSLFGSSASYFSGLDTLNISANYIVNLHSNALQGLDNLRTLDLSNNEIVLHDSDMGFLSKTPRLNELFLRRAFTMTSNRSTQFDMMMKMFEKAKLEKLEVLDLSYNFLSSIPFDLPCPFPRLTRLDLRQNFLTNFVVNETCLANIRTIDLSRNQMHSLDAPFRQLANNLRDDSLILKNSFYCDCKSGDWIRWLRSTKVIREKGSLICDRASPSTYKGTRLVEVPIDKLDCSIDVWNDNAASSFSVILTLLLVSIGLLW